MLFARQARLCGLVLLLTAPASAALKAAPRPVIVGPAGAARLAPVALPLSLPPPAWAPAAAPLSPLLVPSAPPLLPAPAVAADASVPAALPVSPHPAAEAPASFAPPGGALYQLHRALAAWAKPAVEPGGDGAPTAAPAFPVGRSGRVNAYFFDVDDNIFLRLPTKIVVFHKATGAERLISTEEFALVRTQVGREGELKDYEYRGGSEGSFREFRDPPGGNNFIGAVRWAVENLPPEAWQGPSWAAFAKALSDPETAAQVAIVTARGHRPESFLEAFEYLKGRGLIAHLPSLENLFPVGDSADPAAAKVKTVQALLDRVQAAPLRRGARKHSAGFSDDDWRNFTAMAEGLGAAQAADPRRWSLVEIVLYFTGTNDPAHQPGAYVLRAGRLTSR